MFPLIDEGEEVEAATFMPPAFRSTGDSALRKWKAGDIITMHAQIGGGTFGKRQNNLLCDSLFEVAAQISKSSLTRSDGYVPCCRAFVSTQLNCTRHKVL